MNLHRQSSIRNSQLALKSAKRDQIPNEMMPQRVMLNNESQGDMVKIVEDNNFIMTSPLVKKPRTPAYKMDYQSSFINSKKQFEP